MTEQSYTVVLADPDPRQRALLQQQLAPLGCTVLHANNGLEAMEIAGKSGARVVVSEMYLRTTDDDCLIHAIRARKALQHTRCVALTNRATTADRDYAMRSGADAYLIKPTRAERFRYVVGRLATDRGTRSAARGGSRASPGADKSPYQQQQAK